MITFDTTKRLMSSRKRRSVEVINNPARPGSNHKEVNCINYSYQQHNNNNNNSNNNNNIEEEEAVDENFEMQD
jgi:exopolyphosphatase/pppGpp-phosphohydrolase